MRGKRAADVFPAAAGKVTPGILAILTSGVSGVTPVFGYAIGNVQRFPNDVQYESVNRRQSGALQKAAAMESTGLMLVSRKSFVHKFSSQGFQPSGIWYAIDNFINALGIAPVGTHLYPLHPVEISAFQLYVNRHLVPVSHEEHDARVTAIGATVCAILKSWGDNSAAVTEYLGLDTSRGASYADILDTVELYVSGKTNCQCVTASQDGLTVDGVEIIYPFQVRDALEDALRFASSQMSVEPF